MLVADGSFKLYEVCPIDRSSNELWAASLLKRVEYATMHGFGVIHDRSDYDLRNFLYDTWCGDMPWGQARDVEVVRDIVSASLFR